MRSPDGIYGDLLRLQTDISFDLEQQFYRSAQSWGSARRVLDFGAGNCYYAKKLAERNPEKEIICVEKNPELTKRARGLISPYKITVIEGTLTDIPSDLTFDFVIARHVVSYLPDRTLFMDWVARHTSSRAGVLTIDADDDKFFVHPSLPLFNAGIDDFKKKVQDSGGDREHLRRHLSDEWNRHGFAHVGTTPLIVHSDIMFRKELMYLFMITVAECDHGSPLPNAVREELDMWVFDPTAYLQYGLFSSLYERSDRPQ